MMATNSLREQLQTMQPNYALQCAARDEIARLDATIISLEKQLDAAFTKLNSLISVTITEDNQSE